MVNSGGWDINLSVLLFATFFFLVVAIFFLATVVVDTFLVVVVAAKVLAGAPIKRDNTIKNGIIFLIMIYLSTINFEP